MTHTQQRIEEIRKNGYQFNFLDVINDALKNYKKTSFYTMIVIFVFYYILLIFFDFNLLSYILRIKYFEILPKKIDLSEKLPLIHMSRGVLLVLFIAPFTAGLLKMADCADKNKKFNVFTIFYYYRLPYLTNIIGVTLLLLIVNIFISVWMETLGLPFLGKVISLLISLFTYLTIPLIIFGKLNAVKAIKTSLMVTSKKPLILTGVMAVFIGFWGLGKISGSIGSSELREVLRPVLYQMGIFLIFIIPFIYSMTYAIYSSIIGLEIEEPDSNPEISS